jgi:glycerate 2-kinase
VTQRSEAEAVAAIERWFDAALDAVEPGRSVQTHLSWDGRALLVDGRSVELFGRLFVIAGGKAALAMAHGAVAVCGDSIGSGFILTKDGHLDHPLPSRFEVHEASHPIPDDRGVDATERILGMLSEARRGDVVLTLLSGGGSALMEAPTTGVSLDDIARTTELMLNAGAPIQHLNAVRIPLSRVKGGGLRRAAPEARFVTLILSDVLSNDPRVIASGPTVSSEFTGDGAVALLERYGIVNRVPKAVTQALINAPEPADRSTFEDDLVAIVGDNAAAVNAFAQAATADGISSTIAWTAKEGEARELAAEWVDLCINVDPDVDLLLGGGEATVTVSGDGVGGRNTEFALAAALELESRRCPDWVIASLATDGQDAMTGVAGAIASPETLVRARAAGIDPAAALARNASLAVFQSAGGCVAPGPTGTNVNDIYIALRLRH